MTVKASELGQVWALATYTDQGVYDPNTVGFVQSITWTPYHPTIPGVSTPSPSVTPGGCDLIDNVPTMTTPGLFSISVWLGVNRSQSPYSVTDGESITGYFSHGEQQFSLQIRSAKLQRLLNRSTAANVYLRDYNAAFTSVLVNCRSTPQAVTGFVRSIGLKVPATITVRLNIQEILPAAGVAAGTVTAPVGELNAQDRNKVVTFEP